MKTNIIGIDIGGTTVKIGVLNVNGEILSKWSIPTVHGEGIIDSIYDSIACKLPRQAVADTVLGIGVGAPGFVDKESGIEAVNLGWRDFPLAKLMREKFDSPVMVENDANLAALGEYWHERDQQVADLIFVTLGTGVGSGIIANGSLLKGANGTAAEIGHTIVDYNGYRCNCGRVGCLDTIASANGIVRKAMDVLQERPASSLADYYRSRGEIRSQDVFALANLGDSDCLDIVHYAARMLGIALANASAIINPSRIVIGGGLSQAGNQLLQLVQAYFKQYALPRIADVTRIGLAKLGNDAGMIGAARLVLSHYRGT